MLVQHLPDGEEGRERLHARLDHPEWEHIAALAGTLSVEELTDPALGLESLVWRLFHEESEVRVARGTVPRLPLHERVLPRDLARFGEAERAEMADENGEIVVDCAFCSRAFPIHF
jgi:molecular chaperone Hsp33